MEELVLVTWILAAATAGLVVATGLLAWFTGKLVRVTARLAESSERLEEKASEQGPKLRIPYARLEWHVAGASGVPDGILTVHVANQGRQVASCDFIHAWFDDADGRYHDVDVSLNGPTRVNPETTEKMMGRIVISRVEFDALKAVGKLSVCVSTAAGRRTGAFYVPLEGNTT